MFDHLLRPVKDRLLAPAVKLLARRVSPGLVTAIGFAFGVLTALSCALGAVGVALACWVANRVLDGVDGAVARESGTQSDSGGYLDIVLDFIVYAMIPIALAIASGERIAWTATAVLLAACYVNAATWIYLAALTEKRNRIESAATSVAMPRGLVEGAETILFYGLFVLVPAGYPALAFTMGGLTAIGAMIRFAAGLRRLGAADVGG